MSRMSSTLLLLAPSISMTSGLLPARMPVQQAQVPQGSGRGPLSRQFRQRARVRAAVVLPTPRAPEKR